jgi:hypothetical protein
MTYALLVDGREVGRWPTRLQAVEEASRADLFLPARGWPDEENRWLRPGVAIVQIEEE